MDLSQKHIEQLFTEKGGEFISSPSVIAEKLKGIRALLFDWDGVFNEGSKGGSAQSGFSEVDSMGTNLLRFSQWLMQGKSMPACGILTGAENFAAYDFAKREHFHKVYFKVPHKIDALEHMDRVHGIKPEEVAYFFDDVLDISVAREVGLRVFIRSHAKVLFSEYVKQAGAVDYITGFSGGEHGVREACELMIGLNGMFNSVLDHRIEFSETYQEYWSERNKPSTTFYTVGKSGLIIEHHVA